MEGIIYQVENMAITEIEVERVSVISSKPFEKVADAFKAAVGRPDVIGSSPESWLKRLYERLRADHS
jgi:hypothetical protein